MSAADPLVLIGAGIRECLLHRGGPWLVRL